MEDPKLAAKNANILKGSRLFAICLSDATKPYTPDLCVIRDDSTSIKVIVFICDSKLKCWDINTPCDQKQVK